MTNPPFAGLDITNYFPYLTDLSNIKGYFTAVNSFTKINVPELKVEIVQPQ